MKIHVCFFLSCLTAFAFSGETYGADQDLVVYLPMDEGKGGEAIDASGNGHDGTIECIRLCALNSAW